jgi:hypothetical protein
MVHHILPKKGVRTATRKNNQIAHIRSTPRFLPDTLVPRIEVRITIYIITIAKISSRICGHLDTTNFFKKPEPANKSL